MAFLDLENDANPNDTLWRYMDLSKFLSLILNKNICRVLKNYYIFTPKTRRFLLSSVG